MEILKLSLDRESGPPPARLPPKHLVIVVYGVGNASPNDIRKDVQWALDHHFACGAVAEVEVFNWDDYSPHRPPDSELWRSAKWFSDTFIKASYYRLNSQRRATARVTVAFQVLLAFTTVPAALLVPIAALLSILGALLRNNLYLVSAKAVLHWIPAPTLFLARCCGTLAVLILALALIESFKRKCTEPIWTSIRANAFLVLLAPCVLFSMPLLRKPSHSAAKDDTYSPAERGCWWTVSILGVVAVFGENILAGSVGAYTLSIISSLAFIIAAKFLFAMLSKGLQWAATTWLFLAKVLLDISLYVGSPEHRQGNAR